MKSSVLLRLPSMEGTGGCGEEDQDSIAAPLCGPWPVRWEVRRGVPGELWVSRVMRGFICIQGFPKRHYSAIKRNALDSVLIRWMNLEPITQSEANQKEKNSILCYIYMESGKMGPVNMCAGSNGDADAESRLVDSGLGGDRKERVGRIERAAWNTSITTCKTHSLWEFAV